MVMAFEDEFEGNYAIFNPTESKLEATIEKNNQTKNGWVFLGTLTNLGENSWDSATIQIELFDEEGNFMDESDGYVQGAITPGSKHNFKVAFHSCDEETEVVFSDFKATVTGAY